MNRGDNIAAIYLIIAVMMFGHSANNRQREMDRKYTECMTTVMIKSSCENIESAAIGAFFAGLFWPAYVSWLVWDIWEAKQ